MQIITRKEAIAQGLNRYFTGKPCKYGHIVERRCCSKNCLTCEKAHLKAYYEANHEEVLAGSKAYYEANREKMIASQRAYYEANREKMGARRKTWHKANREKALAQQKIYYEANSKKLIARAKVYYEANSKKVMARAKVYRADNPQARAAEALRNRIRLAIRAAGATKSAGSLELLGASIEEVRAHLEAQFKLGMTWDNWSIHGWHIDHIKPCASFDLTDPEQQKACFHYTNLQPLWAKDNLSKHDRLDWVPAEA